MRAAVDSNPTSCVVVEDSEAVGEGSSKNSSSISFIFGQQVHDMKIQDNKLKSRNGFGSLKESQLFCHLDGDVSRQQPHQGVLRM
jgi:hypothetical protein